MNFTNKYKLPHNSYKLIRYNLKVIFANKFVYFLMAAVIIFLIITAINLFDTDSSFDSSSVYWLLLVPGILLIFYPTNFGLQNDVDTRMLETLFGIPNYRYKVHLLRLVITLVMTLFILFFLALISSITLTSFPLLVMIFQLMFPLLFLGAIAFMFSTLVRNGNATAVLMVIFGLFFFFAADALSESRWNLFHNPFSTPSEIKIFIRLEITFYNRLYMVVGSILSVLFGLRNLQKREWFV